MATLLRTALADSGSERARYRVLVTQNSEYHCLAGTCVAVRDLATGQFQQDHLAIGRHLAGSIHFSQSGRIESFAGSGEEPHAGDSVFFSNGKLGEELVTSALRAVAYPANAGEQT